MRDNTSFAPVRTRPGKQRQCARSAPWIAEMPCDAPSAENARLDRRIARRDTTVKDSRHDDSDAHRRPIRTDPILIGARHRRNGCGERASGDDQAILYVRLWGPGCRRCRRRDHNVEGRSLSIALWLLTRGASSLSNRPKPPQRWPRIAPNQFARAVSKWGLLTTSRRQTDCTPVSQFGRLKSFGLPFAPSANRVSGECCFLHGRACTCWSESRQRT